MIEAVNMIEIMEGIIHPEGSYKNAHRVSVPTNQMSIALMYCGVLDASPSGRSWQTI